MSAIALHKIAHYCHKRNVPLVPKLLQGVIFLLFNSYIPYELVMGRGTKLGHRGIGVIINKETIIGTNVLIRAHVTIGKKTEDGLAPVIGNDVEIGDGAKIIGAIIIGDSVVIGANAVVVKDVPPNAIVVGIPARIIGTNDVN